MAAAPTGVLFYDPRDKPTSTVGQFQAGCYRYFYTTGTTVQATIYADGGLTTPLSQPVTATSDGRFPAIYLSSGTIYRCQLYNASNVLLDDTDPYIVSLPGTIPATVTNVTVTGAGPGSFLGNPTGAGPNTALPGTFQNFFYWVTGHANQPGAGFVGMSSDGQSPGWNQGSFSTTAQGANGTGGNLASSVSLQILTTQAVPNSSTDTYATIFNCTSATVALGLFRQLSSGLPIGGFTLTLYASLLTVQPTMTVFLGFTNLISAISGSQTPSALLHSIAIAKDVGDTTLQFLIVDGAAATKISTGITPTSVAGHLLKIVITCDGQGNCAITLTDLEAGGVGTVSQTYPSNTAHLPAVNTKVEPHFYISTGSSSSAVQLGLVNAFITTGFMS